MKKKLKYKTLFYGFSKYATVFVTLLTTAILSRILEPSEFGVVSVITVFTAFFSILADLGLGTAVIQNKTLTDEEVNDIFNFSVYIALVLGIIFAILGIPIAWFYENGVYKNICLILGVAVFFNAINIIPNALLMKRKQFALVGKRLILVATITGGITIILALKGFSYYSLVFQSVFQSIFIFAWNYLSTKVRFRLIFNMESVRKVRQFSFYQFSYNFINYFARNLDNLLIGKVMGNESLGYYDKGYKLMMYPVQNLTYVINPIIHPVLSDYQNDKRYIYISYLKIVRVLSLLGVFITAVCFWGSEEIILLFFGRQWTKSIMLFRMLSLSVWPQLVSTSAGSIYQSTGNTKLMFKSGMIHFTTTILMIVVGIRTGNLVTLAILVSASLYIRFFVDYFFLISRNFKFSYKEFLNSFKYETVIITVLITISFVLDSITKFESLIINLCLKSLILGTTYILLLFITGQLKVLKTILNNWNS